jgi:hypothetical protein
VSAFAKVRKEFDLLFPQRGTERSSSPATTVVLDLGSRGASGTGNAHVLRHNPDHNPHSHFDRRHTDMGPQRNWGIWAFRNCRRHPHHSHHPGAARQAVTARAIAGSIGMSVRVG